MAVAPEEVLPQQQPTQTPVPAIVTQEDVKLAVKSALNQIDFSQLVKDVAPTVTSDIAKVNPMIVTGFMMFLTVAVMAAAIDKLIDPAWFAFALGIWVNTPGTPK